MSYLYKCVYAPDHSGIRKEAIGKSFTFIGRKEKEQVSNGIQFITDDVITLYCSELDYFVEIPDSRLSYYFEPCDIEKKETKEMDKVKQYESNDEMVSHPSHYQSNNGIEVIDVIQAFTEGLEGIEAVDTGNVIKYICRWKHKNGVQDLEKAVWYATHLINHLKNK